MTNADGQHSALTASTLAEAVRNAAARRTSAESLTPVIEMATASAPCDQASITMKGSNRTLRTVAASSELINQADLLQYQLNEGPCLDAVWVDGLFVISAPRYAAMHNRKLAKIAEELVSTGSLPRLTGVTGGSAVEEIANKEMSGAEMSGGQ